ncbi:MAG: c-type cytochrome [Allorhizobium sp.]
MTSKWLKGLGVLAALAVAGGAGFLVITAPDPQPDAVWSSLAAGDPANGRTLFYAGGCASCHAAVGAKDDDRLVLAGGAPLKSPFGTFYAPNISSDPHAGIGGWTLAEFGNAMTRGVGKQGEHLYPAFPYGSYARMTPKDVADLYAFLKTLPASSNIAPRHELPFPFNIRLVLGGWKLLFFTDAPRVTIANADAQVQRGQYLVEGPGHCGECHTPRNALGGFKADAWLAGGPNPEGQGIIPNITPGGKAVGAWSADDIATYLDTGFTPEFDSVGGSMVEVQKNMAELAAQDRAAIAAYLKAVPAR